MSKPIRFYDYARLTPANRRKLLTRTEADISHFIEGVKPIIDNVRQNGDDALVHYARELDKAEIARDAIKAKPENFDRAFAHLDPSLIETIEFAADRIKRFHQEQMPDAMRLAEPFPGVFAGDRFTPISSVACYVPRGKGAFPSVVMMTTIPAVVAGVPKIIILTPPGPDGEIDDATLVAARVAGVDAVYKCGGAQAVAAVAFGTETVPKAVKIVGPGSPWLVAAKKVLADVIDPGTPAGPSESLVLADGSASTKAAALDLIIESEHGPDSSAFLVTPDRSLAEDVMATIPMLWKQMGESRVNFSSTVLGGEKGGVILTQDMDQAIEFVNDYAPEHLEVLSAAPFTYLDRLVNAGEILLGQNTPISLGNFVLGPNAVLPTSGAAKTHSPLSVYDFLKMTSIGYVTPGAYPELARHAHKLATYEGFDGHALAVSDARPVDSSLDPVKTKP
ncbi:histidinol dehydrogenase [Desulfosarcina ovata]|uniref:Histidinol dehydrogenase 2 n=1 Tax=Desulfosarcina ovata subsp. ovata TaxID=2752305 RepID=A0A5K8A884_9BACT|nr:histidinol dehydrogenase [Desulfosarcina ovata]BBO88628.1 histidinol dehydrogenase 2 [Desulfosarcina ovata subsp. ovata]